MTLREARGKLGKTQQQVADAAGMGRAHYALVERGESSLSYEKACRLALVLEVTLDDVYGVKV